MADIVLDDVPTTDPNGAGGPADRACHCHVRALAPRVFDGIPDDHCGLCLECGAAGHLRSFPGAVPYVGAWCDAHYRQLRLTHPLAPFGCLLWVAFAALLGVGAWLALR